MKEAFLQFVWENQYFNTHELRLKDGTCLRVLSAGKRNQDAGADYTGVRLMSGDNVLCGDAELHVEEKMWRAHGHHRDSTYDNVILHIVWRKKDDEHENAAKIPVLVLSDFVPENLYEKYLQLENNSSSVPCDAFLVRDDVFDEARYQAFQLRVREKIAVYEEKLKTLNHDWLALAQWSLFRAMGMNLNAEPFEMLAKALPYKILLKHADNLFQTEALLFGQAGLLAKAEDEYQEKLSKEYRFLSKKYELEPLQEKIWKFSKIRPAAFPTLKMAHLAKLFSQMNVLNDILRVKETSYWKKRLKTDYEGYWLTHYHFGKKNEAGKNTTGEQSVNFIIINGIAYLQATYDALNTSDFSFESVSGLLSKLPHEKNRYTKHYTAYKQSNAFHSQSEVGLFRHFCEPKNCLSCAAGKAVLRESRPMYPEARL
jgi:hypothetical protein